MTWVRVRNWRRRRGRERGQSMVEFALAAPLLLLIAFGVFDFGRGMSANVTVTNSSREGARYLAVTSMAKGSSGSWGTACYGTGGTPAPLADSAQGKAWRQLQNAGLDVTQVTMTVKFFKAANDPANGGTADMTITCAAGSPSITNPTGYSVASGDWVQFEVNYGYAPSTPLIGQIFTRVTMDRITTMVVE